MSRLIAILAVALAFAVAPAGAGQAPGTGTIEIAALSPAQEGGQRLAVPAECGAEAAAGQPLLLAQTNQCLSDCDSDYSDCQGDCDSNDTSCLSNCTSEWNGCKDACSE